MKILTKEKFLEFLVENEACQPGLDWAQSQVEARDIVEKCTNIDHLQWLIEAIGGPMLAKYNKQLAPIWAEYDKKVAPFRVEYDEKRDPIWAEYDEVEYEEKVATFWDKHKKECYTIAREICTFERVQEEIGE